MKFTAESRKTRATRGMAMPSLAIAPQASLNARVVDALKGDPAHDIDTLDMGGNRPVTREEILSTIATRYSDHLEEREEGEGNKKREIQKQQGSCRARHDQETE